MKSEIVSQTPFWYVFICLGLGVGYALFTYFRSPIFKRNPKIILSILRGVLAFLISYLLVNPLIKTFNNSIIKPKVVLVLDNSKSMTFAGKSALDELLDGISALKNDIFDKGFDLEIKLLNEEKVENLKETKFNLNKTNLSSALSDLKNNYEGQNLSDVIVVSDGIINEGVSPSFQKYPFNVHTVGIGDTTIKKDIYISGIAANKLAYLGNDFTVNVDVSSYLLSGKSSTITVKNSSGAVLAQKNININKNDDFQSISFELPADKVGKQRFIAEVKPVEGEYSTKNNIKDFVVDVVNGKEKILLLAYAPHPDIKALKSIIEKNDLFELQIQILQSTEPALIGKDPFDILILHQVPDAYGSSTGIVSTLLAKKKPAFFIVGSKTNIPTFNGMQNVIGINSQLNKFDKTTAKLNSAFQRFTLSDNSIDLIEKLPPVSVPFGEYKLFPGAEVLMSQNIGNINTGRPLLALNLSGDVKRAVFVGEGLWEWRLEEFAMNDNQNVIDDLLVKTLQLLSIKEDKSKLRVYPVLEIFNIDQKIGFEAEAYNNLFERIYDQNVSLKIKDEKGLEKVYDFKISKESSRFELSNLPAGIYSYSASSAILGKTENTTGQFIVSQIDNETENAVADFGLLKTLSNENNGDYVSYKNIIELRKSLETKGLINKVVSIEELKDFINFRWILFLIVLIASIEWALRKYFGGY
ncbi:VWA domain-containing protein [Lacihabitans sp. LS3-19]|uniref:vWA domain-containing protein n=1 Tax=Lacihabitans sp. LS3-19 TaxID=2487335 RepID=UPI0020CCED71|nr:vWA domain-containing protein [Lacihabitans sp. LS3-19]MCP9768184.1 VWA domain-containing protein [Lacihabitans sp. LS3-19]